ncbi:MAG: hypothetical protein WCG25_04585 [bacterium]
MVYGKTNAINANINEDTTATCFSFHSIDFLLQYSLDHESHPIHNHNPHFGDIIMIDHINTIQLKIIIVISNILIFSYIKK